MSKDFEPPGSPPQPELGKVEVFVNLIDGALWPHEGEFAAQLLVRYRAIVARGGLEGWEIIHELLGDDWGAPPATVQILVDGKEVARIPYDKPKRRRKSQRPASTCGHVQGADD
jgi:hypothetical protein